MRRWMRLGDETDMSRQIVKMFISMTLTQRCCNFEMRPHSTYFYNLSVSKR